MKRIFTLFIFSAASLLAFGLGDLAYMANVSRTLTRQAVPTEAISPLPYDYPSDEVYLPAAQVFAWGGKAPYTYAWTHQSGTVFTGEGGGALPVNQAVIQPWGYGGGAGSTVTGTYRCTVTDAAGATTTVDVVFSIITDPDPFI